jgi:protein-S-isoprenylcysteine O-methyltransferase Ste14
MLLGIPIALGSWWGLPAIVAMIPALIWRVLDEEKFLARNLLWGILSTKKQCGIA